MQQISRLAALVPALVLGTGCFAEDPAAVATSTASSAVTENDVDFAPECGGIMTYLNWAPLWELYPYLPNALADAIVARRAVRPFDSIADISSVSGIAQGRLKQITGRAYTYDFIDVECAGVYEEIAVSYEERAAILQLVNTASAAQLEAAARFEPAATAAALIAGRPFTTLQQVADTYGVGTETFRSLRNAANAAATGPVSLTADPLELPDDLRDQIDAAIAACNCFSSVTPWFVIPVGTASDVFSSYDLLSLVVEQDMQLPWVARGEVNSLALATKLAPSGQAGVLDDISAYAAPNGGGYRIGAFKWSHPTAPDYCSSETVYFMYFEETGYLFAFRFDSSSEC